VHARFRERIPNKLTQLVLFSYPSIYLRIQQIHCQSIYENHTLNNYLAVKKTVPISVGMFAYDGLAVQQQSEFSIPLSV